MNKIIIVTIVTIISVLGILLCYKWFQEELMTGMENEIILDFDDIGKKIFVKAKVWGVSGNHEEIILSEKDTNIINKETDYVFYTSEIFYKIENNRRLIIYAPRNLTSEPPEKFADVVIVIKELTTADEIRDYNKHYQKYGLKKISVY